MKILMSLARWTRQKLSNIRDLVSGDDLDEAQSHRSDGWGEDRKVNPGTGGGGFGMGGGGGLGG